MTVSGRSVAALVGLLVASAGSCGAASNRVSRSTATAPTTTTRTSVAPSAAAGRTYETRRSGFTVARPNDPALPTMAVLAIAPVGKGPFPLIVFSHGFQSIAQSYEPALTRIASWGYVVVGPNFPDADYHTHPADISLVIDRVTGRHSPFAKGFVDGQHIASVGHSLGGADVYGVTYNSCCRDRRITAAVTFEGTLGQFPTGTFSWRGAPALIVVGDSDPVLVPGTGEHVFSGFTGSAYLLTIAGGGHGGGLGPTDVGYTSVQATLRDFLAAYLDGDNGALHSLRSHRSRPHTTLKVKR